MIFLGIIILDKLIKFIVIHFNFNFSLNTGAVFGLNLNSPYAYIIPIIFIIIIYFVSKNWRNANHGMGLILLGCIMNITDRLFIGGIIDYIKIFKILVINPADVIIMLGIIIIIYKQYLSEKFVLNNREKR